MSRRARSAATGSLRTPLTTILRSSGAVRVLRALSRHGGVLTVPSIQRASGLTNAGTHRILRALIDTGLVRSEGEGRLIAYRFDAEHPLAAPLAALFADEEARADRVFEAVRVAAAVYRPRAVWLFGSAARGDDEPGSDVDIAVVFANGTPASALVDLRAALAATEDAERVRVSVIGLWPEDVDRLALGDPLWRSLDRDAIPLLGPAPALLRPQSGVTSPKGRHRRKSAVRRSR